MTSEIQVLWSCFTFLLIFLLLASASNVVTPETTTTTQTTTTAAVAIKANETDGTLLTNQMPTAAKLIRFRRQPPYKIIKHIVRSSKHSKPRRRIKRPKIRYGSPNYVNYEHQASYYKPHYSPSTPPETHSFGLDEYPSLNLNAADFELPPSSYEAQSMDLDFYGHAEEENTYQNLPKEVHLSAHEYSGPEFESSVEPKYGYKMLPRKPHQKYGVPKNLEYSSDFNDFNSKPSFYSSATSDYSSFDAYQPETGHGSHGGGSSQYHATSFEEHSPTTALEHDSGGSSQYSSPNIEEHSLSTADSYNPQSHSFQTTQQSMYNVESSRPDVYSFYDTKIPNSGFSQNYATHAPAQPIPPQSYPTPAAPDVKITYSPSYEINIMPPNQANGVSNQYESPDPHIQPGNFAEPPEMHQPTSHYSPGQDIQPIHGPLDYVAPSQELPLNPYHKQPAYDFPKSSYEVPIYDPIPFEASTNDEQEYYPPHSKAPPVALTTQQPQPQEKNFESQFNMEQQRPHERPMPADKEIPKDTHTSESDAVVSSTSTTKQRRNRKQQRRPLIGSTKHILDVPELKAAFEAAKPTKYALFSTSNADVEANASSFVEQKQKVTTTNKSNNNYFNQEWNPMRIRNDYTTPHAAKATTFSLKKTGNDFSNATQTNKIKTHIRSRLQPLTTVPTPFSTHVEASVKPAHVSIEKSRSQSYYDGTLAPSILTMSNAYNSRLSKYEAPTRIPVPKSSPATTPAIQNFSSKDAKTIKRTTKSIFDTTHFKVPQSNLDGSHHKLHLSLAGLNLPKNHKVF